MYFYYVTLRKLKTFPSGKINFDVVKQDHGKDVNRCQSRNIKRGRIKRPLYNLPFSPQVYCGQIQDSAASSFACAFLSCSYLQILYSWEAPAPPTKKLTAKRFQFFGIITNEYLDQINPVAVSTPD